MAAGYKERIHVTHGWHKRSANSTTIRIRLNLCAYVSIRPPASSRIRSASAGDTPISQIKIKIRTACAATSLDRMWMGRAVVRSVSRRAELCMKKRGQEERSSRQGRSLAGCKCPYRQLPVFGRLAYPMRGEATNRVLLGRKSPGCPAGVFAAVGTIWGASKLGGRNIMKYLQPRKSPCTKSFQAG